MTDNKPDGSELIKLMGIIHSHYSKEEIDWYLSLVTPTKEDNNVKYIVSSNSYADEK